MQDRKEYQREYHKKWAKENKEKLAKYNKTYQREYYDKNKEVILKKAKKYAQENRELLNKIAREYYKKNKEKSSVRSKTRDAVKKGLLIKKDCRICGNKESEIHHQDYNNYLDIIWLCRKCHLNLHREIRAYSKQTPTK